MMTKTGRHKECSKENKYQMNSQQIDPEPILKMNNTGSNIDIIKNVFHFPYRP